MNLTYKNISKYISILHKVKHILDNNSLYTLYGTLIVPYLSYACEIWGNTYPTRLNNSVMLQKRAIRIIDKAKYRDNTDPLFSKYKCLKFHELVYLKTLIIVHKAKNDLLPINVKIWFNKTEDVHKYNTRASPRGHFDEK